MHAIKIALIPLVAIMGLYGGYRLLDLPASSDASATGRRIAEKDLSKDRLPAKSADFSEPGGEGFALVELFTSEGCSSCPPADKLLSAIHEEHKDHVYVLGYHVDYWDRLGWKDPFSSADYSRRQSEYARAFRLNGVYTPQVVVNGKKEFVGSDEPKLRATIADELKNSGGETISLKVTKSDNNKITVQYHLAIPNGAKLNIALVQSEAASRVLAGENKGRSLDHVNVVRDFKTATGAGLGAVDLNIPQGLTEKDCKVIYFLQNEADLHILGAGEIN